MIAVKNIIILFLIETTVFYGGFYFNDVLQSLNPMPIAEKCLTTNVVEHQTKKKRIRWGNSKITGNSNDGWGFR